MCVCYYICACVIYVHVLLQMRMCALKPWIHVWSVAELVYWELLVLLLYDTHHVARFNKEKVNQG